MPAEWESHAATWLGWPHNPTDWPDKLDTIRWVYGEMVRKLAPGETARILVRNAAEGRLAQRYLGRAGADVSRVEFIKLPTNRGWMRDSGPIFVRRTAGGRQREEGRGKRSGGGDGDCAFSLQCVGEV
jgi:agmatine deiminase